MVGLAFAALGIFLIMAAWGPALDHLSWSGARATTGRVMVTDWEMIEGANRLKITYAYEDSKGVDHHASGILPRKLGQLSLSPGSPVVVLYRPDKPDDSRLRSELDFWECAHVMLIGVVVTLVAAMFFAAALGKELPWLGSAVLNAKEAR